MLPAFNLKADKLHNLYAEQIDMYVYTNTHGSGETYVLVKTNSYDSLVTIAIPICFTKSSTRARSIEEIIRIHDGFQQGYNVPGKLSPLFSS